MMAGLLLVQPLYAPHVRVAKGMYKNIVIIATEFNSVYGFDAGAPKAPCSPCLCLSCCPCPHALI